MAPPAGQASGEPLTERPAPCNDVGAATVAVTRTGAHAAAPAAQVCAATAPVSHPSLPATAAPRSSASTGAGAAPPEAGGSRSGRSLDNRRPAMAW